MPVLRPNRQHTKHYEKRLDQFRRLISLGASRQEIQATMLIGKTTFHKMHNDIALEDKEEAYARVNEHENILMQYESMMLRCYRECIMKAQNPKTIDSIHAIEVAANLATQVTKSRMFGISKVLESSNNRLVLTDNNIPINDTTSGNRRLQQSNGELRGYNREQEDEQQEKSEIVYE